MIDCHCHLADEAFAGDLEAVVGRAQAAGVAGCALYPVGRRRQGVGGGACACGRSGRTSGFRSASTRTRRESSPAGARTRVPASVGDRQRRGAGDRRDWPRLPLRLLAPRRAAGGLPRPGRPRAGAGVAGRHPHARGHRGHVRNSSRGGRRGPRRVPLLYRRPWHGACGARSRLLRIARRDCHVPACGSSCGRSRDSCPTTACSSRPTRPIWRRFLTVGSGTSPPSSGAWQRRLPGSAASRRRHSARRRPATSRHC